MALVAGWPGVYLRHMKKVVRRPLDNACCRIMARLDSVTDSIAHIIMDTP